MNYLVRMFCSDDSLQSMMGNFLADFVEGRFARKWVFPPLHNSREALDLS
jgi:acyl carrier protein phosphodiesterase